MMKRLWLVGLLTAAPATAWADEPKTDTKPEQAEAKPVYTFGTLRAMEAEQAKRKLGLWLESVGKSDAVNLDDIFANESASAFELTLKAIKAAVPEAEQLLDEAADPLKSAPTEVPALIANQDQDPFFRANLATAYGRALASRRVYEEALDAMKGIAVEQLVDPSSYYFYKAVAEHALIQRAAATYSIARLLDDVTDAPDRYRTVATLMFFDIQSWPKDEKDLVNIEKLMDNSGRRLDLARGGPKTQEIQEKIVFQLDELIKEKEKQKGQGQGQGQGEGDGDGSGSGDQPSSPMSDSNIATNGGPGTIDEKKLRQYAENWGQLPAAERAKAIQEITRDLPPKYKPMIEEYFKSLNRMHGFKP